MVSNLQMEQFVNNYVFPEASSFSKKVLAECQRAGFRAGRPFLSHRLNLNASGPNADPRRPRLDSLLEFLSAPGGRTTAVSSRTSSGTHPRAFIKASATFTMRSLPTVGMSSL